MPGSKDLCLYLYLYEYLAVENVVGLGLRRVSVPLGAAAFWLNSIILRASRRRLPLLDQEHGAAYL